MSSSLRCASAYVRAALGRALPTSSPSSSAAEGRFRLTLTRGMGGARPGGVPTFNWKEKRALGIGEGTFAVKKAKVFNADEGTFGEFEEQQILGGKPLVVEVDLATGFDSAKYAPVEVDSSSMAAPVAASADDRRVDLTIDTGALFGAAKATQRTYAVDKRKHNYRDKRPVPDAATNPYFKSKYSI